MHDQQHFPISGYLDFIQVCIYLRYAYDLGPLPLGYDISCCFSNPPQLGTVAFGVSNFPVRSLISCNYCHHSIRQNCPFDFCDLK